MSRRTARENLMKIVYEKIVVGQTNELTTQIICGELEDADKSYISNTLKGIDENFDKIKTDIAEYASGYAIDRIFKVDLSILVIAFYEIEFDNTIPYAVSANEAVELTKKYSTDNSAGFVNGVLASFIRDMNKETV